MYKLKPCSWKTGHWPYWPPAKARARRLPGDKFRLTRYTLLATAPEPPAVLDDTGLMADYWFCL